jgi:hypothetical protein
MPWIGRGGEHLSTPTFSFVTSYLAISFLHLL